MTPVCPFSVECILVASIPFNIFGVYPTHTCLRVYMRGWTWLASFETRSPNWTCQDHSGRKSAIHEFAYLRGLPLRKGEGLRHLPRIYGSELLIAYVNCWLFRKPEFKMTKFYENIYTIWSWPIPLLAFHIQRLGSAALNLVELA